MLWAVWYTQTQYANIARSSNGRTSGFGPEYRGSNPCRAAEFVFFASEAFHIVSMSNPANLHLSSTISAIL